MWKTAGPRKSVHIRGVSTLGSKKFEVGSQTAVNIRWFFWDLRGGFPTRYFSLRANSCTLNKENVHTREVLRQVPDKYMCPRPH